MVCVCVFHIQTTTGLGCGDCYCFKTSTIKRFLALCLAFLCLQDVEEAFAFPQVFIAFLLLDGEFLAFLLGS